MARRAAAEVALLSAQTVWLSSRCNATKWAKTWLHHTLRRAPLRLRVPICESGCQHALRRGHARP